MILLFILTTFAFTKIVVEENIFNWLRKLLPFKPFTCLTCMSVWSGILLSFLFPPLFPFYFNWFICGLISYTIVYFSILLEIKLMK